jgi:hypothetical protein
MQLLYKHFLVLYLIDAHAVNGKGPTQRQLFDSRTKAGYVNTFIEFRKVDRAFCPKLTGVRQLHTIIKVLQGCALVEVGRYVLTRKGRIILDFVGTSWPTRATLMTDAPAGAVCLVDCEYEELS